MKFLTDTIYIHYATKSKSFYITDPEPLIEFKSIETLIMNLVSHMNLMRSIRRFNYSPLIYTSFVITILCTILVYYYGYLTIAALAFLALTILFIVLKYLKGKAVDKELSDVVFEYLEDLRTVFEIKIKSSEFFIEFKKTPAVVLKPHNPFNELFKSADLKFMVEDKSHLSLSLSVNQKEMASKRLSHFFDQARERGMMISTNKKAELYRYSKTKLDADDVEAIPETKDREIVSAFVVKVENPEKRGREESSSIYTIDQMKKIVFQGLNN